MKILIAGDFCQCNRVDELIRSHNYSSLFEEVSPLIQQADYSVVNFEFPIVASEDRAKPIAKCGPNLRGSQDSVNAIKNAGFNVCTLANNHILDQGEDCCVDTINLLEEAGLKTVGAGRNLYEASDILYLEKEQEIIAIINCCEHEFTIATESTAGANPLNPIQQYYKIQEAKLKSNYVLVIVHGGHEEYQLPSPRMKETYHFFIEAGADAVVNHHQHCYSGYEIYKGKPIFYGLGNFLFDNPNKRNDIWNQGFITMLTFIGRDVKFEIIPFNQCNDKATTALLTQEEQCKFDEKIESFNEIISSDSLLKAKHEAWMNNTREWFELQFTPWESWWTRELFRRGLLPALVSNKKKHVLMNFIECESHHDKMVYVLRNLFGL